MNTGKVAHLPFVDSHVYRLGGNLFLARQGGNSCVAVFRGEPATYVEWVLYRLTEEGEQYQGLGDGAPLMYLIFADDTCIPCPGERGPLDLSPTKIEWVADSLDELRAQIQQEEDHRFRAFMAGIGW